MPSNTTTWLVTGANRGIGLELVRQLLQTPTNLVVATARAPEKAIELNTLKESAKGTLHVVQLDVADFDNVRALPTRLAPMLAETGLGYLINNAGIAARDKPFEVEPEKMLEILRTNAVGPALVSRVLLPLLDKGKTKKILHISSTGASLATAAGDTKFEGKYTAYSMSKAALNMLAQKQKANRPDIIVIALCPGWIKTAMGGENALFEVSETIPDVLKIITSATTADSGKFLRYNGEEIPF